MKVNEVLSKEMRVNPLKEGETAIFRLHSANKLGNKFTEDGLRVPINRQVHQIPGIDIVYDPIKGTRVKIGNVTSEELVTKDNKTTFEPIVEPIWIENGEITLNHRQNDTYFFLMRHNDNSTNPFRDHTKKAEFYLVDHVAEKNEKISYDAIEDDAIILLKEADIEELLTIAANLEGPFAGRVNQSNPIDIVRHDLRNIVREGNPQVIIKASRYIFGKLKIQVIEAEKWGIIKRSSESRSWFDHESKELISVDPGTDMVDALVKWFDTQEGKAYYQGDFKKRTKIFKLDS